MLKGTVTLNLKYYINKISLITLFEIGFRKRLFSNISVLATFKKCIIEKNAPNSVLTVLLDQLSVLSINVQYTYPLPKY